MRWYVCHLEKTIINLCENLGLKAETSPHTGVWINDNKVCAIGVHGSQFITSHGLALNCCTNLEWYRHIVPCGIKDKWVTSLSKELNRHVSIDEIMPLFLNSFCKTFNCTYVDVDRSPIMTVEPL
uniref:lipoyl(octanoyl) transferase n=2 Tax=Photinus pyralis TaxID=7054 RepID=A0A1Y1KUY8_PHOPY